MRRLPRFGSGLKPNLIPFNSILGVPAANRTPLFISSTAHSYIQAPSGRYLSRESDPGPVWVTFRQQPHSISISTAVKQNR